MSELYSIKKETLTDIADALRARHGETEWVDIVRPKVVVTASPESTGYDNFGGSKNIGHVCYVFTIPNAVSLKYKIKANVSTYTYAYSESSSVSLWVAPAEYTVDTFPRTDEYLLADTSKNDIEREFEFTGTDTITIYYKDLALYSGARGFYGELTGYDEDGNIIEELQPTEVIKTYKSSEMAQAINDITSAPLEDAYLITGSTQYKFYLGSWDWFIQQYGSQIITQDIINASSMFSGSKVTSIPFEINFKSSSSYIDIPSIFSNCNNLTEVPKMNNCKPSGTKSVFEGCQRLTNIPADFEDWFDWSYIETATSAYTGPMNAMFANCYSLRSIPLNIFEHSNPATSYSNSYLSGGFNSCYVVDEFLELPLPFTATWTSNVFGSTFQSCHRVKDITFALQEDGSPYVMKWKSQTITLTGGVGYSDGGDNRLISYNSGLTKATQVDSPESYAALKDNPDWWTCSYFYSRYNHDSAVTTINSLPDTSAYLATAGGTNTIKFKGTAGRDTDGGAIETLTEEEIAVAAARGWTVSLA